jgi:hypothetical protein
MGPPALFPIRKEGVLRVLIALKNPLPWPASNPRPLGPVASKLNTTPPTRHCVVIHHTERVTPAPPSTLPFEILVRFMLELVIVNE